MDIAPKELTPAELEIALLAAEMSTNAAGTRLRAHIAHLNDRIATMQSAIFAFHDEQTSRRADLITPEELEKLRNMRHLPGLLHGFHKPEDCLICKLIRSYEILKGEK